VEGHGNSNRDAFAAKDKNIAPGHRFALLSVGLMNCQVEGVKLLHDYDVESLPVQVAPGKFLNTIIMHANPLVRQPISSVVPSLAR